MSSKPGKSFDSKLSRRAFLERTVKAGLTVSAAGGLAIGLHEDTIQPTRDPPFEEALLDFRVESAGQRMSIVTGADRAAMARLALDALGGIGRFVKAGDKVLIKPNVGFASPPGLGATTHPDLVREVVRSCVSAGASEIVTTDNPVNDPESCFRLTGIGEAVESAGGRVLLPLERRFRLASLAGGELLREWPMLLEPFDGVDKVIGICPVKDHVRSGATLSIKNWYGLLGGRRNLFHQRIHDLIVELAMLVRPTLVILDGTVSMMNNGPTGGSLSDLKETRTMIAGTDPVAVDSCGITLLGRSPRDFAWIQKASTAGLGNPDYESLNPVRDSVA